MRFDKRKVTLLMAVGVLITAVGLVLLLRPKTNPRRKVEDFNITPCATGLSRERMMKVLNEDTEGMGTLSKTMTVLSSVENVTGLALEGAREVTIKAIGRESLRWSPSELMNLRFCFLPGSDPKHIALVKKAMIDWEGKCKVKFTPLATFDSTAEIRISFEPENDFRSLVGRESKTSSLKDGKSSMYLGFTNTNIEDDLALALVRHELGHALSLLHEHQHPNDYIPWKSLAELALLSRKGPGWVETNIIKRETWGADLYGQREPDKKSVMRYAIPKEWVTIESYAAPRNYDISNRDGQTVDGNVNP